MFAHQYHGAKQPTFCVARPLIPSKLSSPSHVALFLYGVPRAPNDECKALAISFSRTTGHSARSSACPQAQGVPGSLMTQEMANNHDKV